jgi:hypothetical protein
MEDNIKPNPEVELKEYRIISKYLDKKNDETSKDIELPTPESLEKLCSTKIVKDCITFDAQKYKSFIEVKINENSKEEEITIINLDKI